MSGYDIDSVATAISDMVRYQLGSSLQDLAGAIRDEVQDLRDAVARGEDVDVESWCDDILSRVAALESSL